MLNGIKIQYVDWDVAILVMGLRHVVVATVKKIMDWQKTFGDFFANVSEIFITDNNCHS